MASGKLFQRIEYLRKTGGFKLICAYSQIGILGSVSKDCIKGLVKNKSAHEIYSKIQYRVDRILQDKYKPVMLEALEDYEGKALKSERSNFIWICWLQGMDNAPTLVRICLESLRKNLSHKEIVIIDDVNRQKYVVLPDFIEKRWAKKRKHPTPF